MTPEETTEKEVQLNRRADIAADVAGYLLGAAILFVMFALSGSLF